MDRQNALALLGLTEPADAAAVRSAFEAKAAETRERLASAPTESLRSKYERMLAELEQARHSLLAQAEAPPPSAAGSPLSSTMIADLPGAAPSYTQGPSGASNVPGAAVALKAGDVLMERYEVREQIGAGGMGAVFRAYDRMRSEEVALKVMLPGLLSNEKARERFFAEAKISSKLSHPNIVNVFDVQSDGRHTFLTMELLEGQTLRQLMDARKAARQRFGVKQVREIVGTLCDALQYAHEYTVHRDIKPENVFLTTEGKIKLMDFGIARMLRTSQMTETVAVMGTAYYMAPEALAGAAGLDGRADQYALGVMMYEMLTGKVPAGRIKALREVREDVPRALSEAVDRALEPEAEDRFESIAAFGEALRGAAAGRAFVLPSLGGLVAGKQTALLAGAAVVALGAVVALSPLRELVRPVSAEERADLVRLQVETEQMLSSFAEVEEELKERVDDAEQRVRRLEDAGDPDAAEFEEARRLLAAAEAAREAAMDGVLRGERRTRVEAGHRAAAMLADEEQVRQAAAAFTEVRDSLRALGADLDAVESAVLASRRLEETRTAWESARDEVGIEDPAAVVEALEETGAAVALLEAGDFDEAAERFGYLREVFGAALEKADKEKAAALASAAAEEAERARIAAEERARARAEAERKAAADRERLAKLETERENRARLEAERRVAAEAEAARRAAEAEARRREEEARRARLLSGFHDDLVEHLNEQGVDRIEPRGSEDGPVALRAGPSEVLPEGSEGLRKAYAIAPTEPGRGNARMVNLEDRAVALRVHVEMPDNSFAGVYLVTGGRTYVIILEQRSGSGYNHLADLADDGTLRLTGSEPDPFKAAWDVQMVRDSSGELNVWLDDSFSLSETSTLDGWGLSGTINVGTAPVEQVGVWAIKGTATMRDFVVLAFTRAPWARR